MSGNQTTLTLSEQTCGLIHEALEGRVRNLVDALTFSEQFPDATVVWLKSALSEAQDALDEFERVWFEAEEAKRA